MASEVYKPTEEELALLKRWYAPDVGEQVDDSKTNALGMNVAKLAQQRLDQAAALQTSDEGVMSAQSLEEITAQAQEQGYQEGLIKGKEQGLLTGHEAGFEQGLAQGIEEGLAQGLAQAQPEIDQKIALINTVLDKIQQPLTQQNEQIESALLDLALTLARKVIHTEIKQQQQPIIQSVSEGVRIIGHNDPINIRIHPEDMAAVESLFTQCQRREQQLTIEADNTLMVGDCIIDTVNSSVTLTMAERITQVFDDFMSKPTPDNEYIDNTQQGQGTEHDEVKATEQDDTGTLNPDSPSGDSSDHD